MTLFRIALAGALMLAGPPVAYAQTAPTFTIFGESDETDLAKCGISHRDSIREAERLFHANGVATLPHSDKTFSTDVILGYINLSALPIQVGDEDTGSCAISLRVEFYSNGNFDNPTNGASHFGKLVYYDNGALIIHTASGAQDEVNAYLQRYVPDCLEEYERSKN